jgi:hypothetical protein
MRKPPVQFNFSHTHTHIPTTTLCQHTCKHAPHFHTNIYQQVCSFGHSSARHAVNSTAHAYTAHPMLLVGVLLALKLMHNCCNDAVYFPKLERRSPPLAHSHTIQRRPGTSSRTQAGAITRDGLRLIRNQPRAGTKTLPQHCPLMCTHAFIADMITMAAKQRTTAGAKTHAQKPA